MSQPTVTMCPTLANPEAFSTVPELREELHRANASILKMADQLHALSCVTQDISERLSRMVQEIMKEPDTHQKFEASRLTPVSSSSAQTAEMLKAYRAQWTPVVQRSGFKP